MNSHSAVGLVFLYSVVLWDATGLVLNLAYLLEVESLYTQQSAFSSARSHMMVGERATEVGPSLGIQHPTAVKWPSWSTQATSLNLTHFIVTAPTTLPPLPFSAPLCSPIASYPASLSPSPFCSAACSLFLPSLASWNSTRPPHIPLILLFCTLLGLVIWPQVRLMVDLSDSGVEADESQQ